MKCFKPAVFICASLLATNTLAKVSILDKDQAIASVPYSWTGLYAGLNLGAVRHAMNITDNQAVTFNATIQQVTDPRFTGGLQIGYRHQLDLAQASGVFGLEVSSDYSAATSRKEYGSPFSLYQLDSQHKLKNVSLAELMAGIAADRTLLFFTVGLSWFDISGFVRNEDGVPFFDEFSVGKKDVAVVVGGGVEYALNDKFSVRVKVDVPLPETYTNIDNVGNTYDIANNIVLGTVGVNYRFG